jgi:hypothetical protein
MKSRLVPLALAAALFCWLFAEALFGSGVFAFRDAGDYYYPLLKLVRDQWISGRVPLWNPYENLGTPLAANATACVFYPGMALLLLPIGYAWAYKLVILGHVALAAWSAYCLARDTKSSREAATLAAISYAFSGSVLFQYTNLVFLIAAAWLPLALLTAQRMLVRRQARWALAFGVVLAMLTLGGDPQTAYHAVLLATLYAWLLGRAEPRNESKRILDFRFWILDFGFSPQVSGAESKIQNPKSKIALLATACVAGLLLAAVEILPAVEFTRHSGRSHSSLPRTVYEIPGYLLSPAAEPPPAQSRWTDALTCRRLEPLSHQQDIYQFSVGPWRLAEFLWPNVSGRQFPVHHRWLDVLPAEGRVWSPSLYMGLLPLLLALSAMRFRRADPRIVWWSWSVLLAVLAALGWFGPGWLLNELRAAAGGDPARPWLVGPPCGGLYWLATVLLPGYVYFRYPAKLLSIAALGLSLLAAEGWDRAASGDVTRTRRWLVGLAGLSLLGAVAALGVRPWWPQWMASVRPDPVFGPLDAIGAASDLLLAFGQTAAIGLAAWWLLGRLGRGGRWVLPTLLVLTVVDLGLANRWMVATAPARDWQTPSPVVQRIRQDASFCRVYRDPFWLPPSWQRQSSADRLGELLRWDCRTLASKHNLSVGIPLANVAGTMMDYDYEVLLQIPWDQSPTGRDLPDLPFSLPLCLELTGSRYLVLPAMSPEERERFTEAVVGWASAHQGGLKPTLRTLRMLETPDEETVSLWHNPRALPRAWVVHDVVTLPPLATADPRAIHERAEQVLLAGGKLRDLRRTAVVETAISLSLRERAGVRGSYPGPVNGVEPDSPPVSETPAGARDDACRVVDINPQRVEVDAELTRPGLVVLGDQYDPGWRLEVRTAGQVERSATILRTDRVLRGVWLPAGRHHLTYTYRPTLFYLGAALSLLAWLALGLAILRCVRKNVTRSVTSTTH